MANSLIVWGLYSMVGVSAATGVGVATGVIPLKNIERAVDSVFGISGSVASVPAEKPTKLAKLDPKPQVAQPKKKDTQVEVVEPNYPAFDLLRVEKDGSVVVAGRSEANSKVELVMPDGTTLGQTKAGSSGEFVIVLDNPLKPGDYSLFLRSTKPGVAPLNSEEVATVHVPDKSGGEVLALVTKQGSASRVMVKPSAPAKKAEPATQIAKLEKKPEKVAKSEPATVEEPKVEKAKVEAVKTEEPKAEEPKVVTAKAEIPKPAPAEPKVSKTVIVEAVEIENGTLFIAGAASRGDIVRLYINNSLLGDVRGTADGRFLLQRKYNLKPGRHLVRADVISKKNGTTLARAEVPLVHAPTVVVAKAEPVKPEVSKPVVETKVVAKVEDKAVQTAPVEVEVASTEEAFVAPEQDEEVIRTGSTIIIKPGDNLWQISRKTYGHGMRYTTIYNANRDQIRDPSRIYIGQIFKIPQKAVQ